MSQNTNICKICKLEKNINFFSITYVKNDIVYYRSVCKNCFNKQRSLKLDKIYYQEYYKKNKNSIILKTSIYNKSHKEDCNKRTKKWQKNHPEKAKEWHKNKMSDPAFRLRSNMSRSIREALFKVKSSKGNRSFLKTIGYSLIEIKKHIENQFESWMTWDNYGRYNTKTWNDNDFTTWTWTLDHIIPQSDLPYTSMEDDNFKKCWVLSNLRPLSAKQNNLDGVKRTRHGDTNVI